MPDYDPFARGPFPAGVRTLDDWRTRWGYDFPVAWVKKYGKGNVFYSTFGHPDAAWDNPDIQKMYFEAIRWALGLVDYTPRPHPIP